MPRTRALHFHGLPLGSAVIVVLAGSAMLAQRTLGPGFLPHGNCYTWIPGLLWLHAVSDSVIAVAYMTIPITLLYVINRRNDLPFGWMFVLFTSFIIACGATHAMDVWTIWTADYWLSGAMKAFTAALSVPTAIVLIWLVPKALAIPSSDQLRQARAALGKESDSRAEVERRLRDSQHQFRDLFETAPDAMVMVDQDGLIVLLNLQVEKQFGYQRHELLGVAVTTIVPAGLAGHVAADASSRADVELSAKHKDGTGFPIEIRLTPLYGAEGKTVTAVIRRIGARMAAQATEESSLIERERAEATLNSIADAVACTDVSGNITFLNLAAENMTGWSLQEAEGVPMTEVVRLLDVDTRSVVLDATTMASEWEGGDERHDNRVLMRRDGLEVAIEDSVAVIRDRIGKPIGAVVVLRDVSTARATSLQVTHLAQHDFLTGLPNRVLFNDRLGQAIAAAQRNAKSVAVLFLDLDGFKHINDSLGHAIGDEVLRSVARRLEETVRGVDTVSRQGGDEFVVLLAEVRLAEDVAIAAQRLLRAVGGVHSVGHHDLHISTSIGVSVYPDDGTDAETLMKNADTAMYDAKANGRHSYRFFKRAMNVRAIERQWTEENLRFALERDELALHYQPKVDLITGRIIGAEALLRWTHPVRGAISPGDFIPIAEDCGLIVPIDHWVLREACRQAKAWTRAGLPDIVVAVNLSAVELRNERFVEGVLAILAETGIDPHLLELELTEGVLMKNTEPTASILGKLRAHGVKIAIDDFGTGYSSLSYLHRFPIDTLKIDQSFIHQVSKAPIESSLVAAIISMGKSLGVRVVAEGVETAGQLAFLQARGCDAVQGYLFSRPVPHAQFASVLRSGFAELFASHRRAMEDVR